MSVALRITAFPEASNVTDLKVNTDNIKYIKLYESKITKKIMLFYNYTCNQ
jgi:hypothetical protein